MEIILRFLVFGESQFLDSGRLSLLFPCQQSVPGRRRRSRRDDDGFLRYKPSAVGQNVNFGNFNLFGHVPIGSFVRKDLCRTMEIINKDIFHSSFYEVSLVVVILCILFCFFVIVLCEGCGKMVLVVV